MELTFTPLRAVLLAVCLGLFAMAGGFFPPESHLGLEGVPARAGRSWLICVAMFVAGAVSATLVDHQIGMMPPTSLRPVYVVGGILLMGASAGWYRSLLWTWTEQMGAL